MSNAVLKYSGKKADKIIAISENTKIDCIKYLQFPEEKIAVTPLAVDDVFGVIPNKSPAKEHLKAKFGISKPFILSVGTLEKRKNLPFLIRTFAQIKKKNFPHVLVIAGKKGWKYEDIFSTVKELNLTGSVLFLNHVSLQELVYLYNTADLFVYPSLYEGFGLPPLEAMACGCPVVASNTSSLPEVVGDTGYLSSPYDLEKFTQNLVTILRDPDLQQDLSNRGIERAKSFSYSNVTSKTIKIYEEEISC